MNQVLYRTNHFYIINRSYCNKETFEVIINNIIQELKNWGFSVSRNFESISDKIDIRLIDDENIKIDDDSNSYSIVISEKGILKEENLIVNANKLWNVKSNVIAIIIVGDVPKYSYGSTICSNLLFSPMCLIHVLKNKNYDSLISFLVNTIS